MTIQALVNGRVLLDEGFVEGRAVLLEGERIAAITGADDERVRGATRHDVGGAMLLPGFIDCQVNGGGGALFNDDPSVATIEAIGRAHRRFGTTAFLPTLISDDLSVIRRAIAAVREAIERRVPGVIGVHIEGPYINAARKGAHDAAKFRDLDERGVALLSSLGTGRTLVTLAPEMTEPETIRKLADSGVVISAGHTDATFEETLAAFRAGVSGVTHLFNAMSPMTNREPGTVGAALHDADCWCGLIVDGRHVHPAVMRLALRAKGPDRFMLVTDAMPSVGSSHDHFMLQGRRIRVRDGVCIDENGTLAGSAIDMATAVRNAITMLGVPLEMAVRMASGHPARFLRLDREIGRIAPGMRANLVVADERLGVRDTWIDGRLEDPP
ncbi:MAG TPA: N-acetylglucosamine-6-phosphate deacetylase [Usitatibacter sp.]|jgi:N-acetylglucosamine-6-phosphate deacetylase|nr:N-acetylglucosamine-6-phosphate deacetylase [Usitatibacter sp.]